MSQATTVTLPEPGKPKLLDQVRHRCRLRHLALSTEHSYVGWIRRFILFHHKRHPLEMGAKEVSDFLTNLAVAGHVAASTQNQALSALLFLYREVLEKDFGWLDDLVRANKPKRLPAVFTPEEAVAIIGERMRCGACVKRSNFSPRKVATLALEWTVQQKLLRWPGLFTDGKSGIGILPVFPGRQAGSLSHGLMHNSGWAPVRRRTWSLAIGQISHKRRPGWGSRPGKSAC